MDHASSRWARGTLCLTGVWAAGAVVVPKGRSYGVVSVPRAGPAARGVTLTVTAYRRAGVAELRRMPENAHRADDGELLRALRFVP
ncbi:hypothetical protein IPZ58_10670 [Streptomyces roseoverticillatus]|uniref:hypothetical protein n=1 Tax=Streptomyces roseoverticillatus TaxID=66429 RepID=UPI001F26DF88|nr:hypothetical protein [Streptomyces roseoverticillatus]MCF3102048.1 hypothetical protein [Streptomyces roseoverticillatus]